VQGQNVIERKGERLGLALGKGGRQAGGGVADSGARIRDSSGMSASGEFKLQIADLRRLGRMTTMRGRVEMENCRSEI
jgi:hypothetical protein